MPKPLKDHEVVELYYEILLYPEFVRKFGKNDIYDLLKVYWYSTNKLLEASDEADKLVKQRTDHNYEDKPEGQPKWLYWLRKNKKYRDMMKVREAVDKRISELNDYPQGSTDNNLDFIKQMRKPETKKDYVRKLAHEKNISIKEAFNQVKEKCEKLGLPFYTNIASFHNS